MQIYASLSKLIVDTIGTLYVTVVEFTAAGTDPVCRKGGGRLKGGPIREKMLSTELTPTTPPPLAPPFLQGGGGRLF